MDNLKIVSLNVRGVGDFIKRRKMFRFFKGKNADVCLLQETHSVNEDQNKQWGNEWGNKSLYSNGSSNARGIGILFSKRFANKVQDVVKDDNGRYIICKLEINGITYCIANLYAPNNVNGSFFATIFEVVKTFD